MTEIAVGVAHMREAIRKHRQAADRAAAISALPLSMPLVLDLDGTLIAGDLLYKSFFSILRRNPLIVFSCAAWLLRGRAALKRQLALRNRIDWERLALHRDVLDLARREKAAGRTIVLATAADAVLAGHLAARLGFFDQMFASDGEQNLKGIGESRASQPDLPGRLHLCGRQQGGPRGMGARRRDRSRECTPIGP